VPAPNDRAVGGVSSTQAAGEEASLRVAPGLTRPRLGAEGSESQAGACHWEGHNRGYRPWRAGRMVGRSVREAAADHHAGQRGSRRAVGERCPRYEESSAASSLRDSGPTRGPTRHCNGSGPVPGPATLGRRPQAPQRPLVRWQAGPWASGMPGARSTPVLRRR